MKKLIKKLIVFMITSAFMAGFIFCGGFRFRVPFGVFVDGINVGGKTYATACNVLRERARQKLKDNSLRVFADGEEYVFSYPEIDFVDDVSKILHESKKGGEYFSTTRYYLKGAKNFAELLAKDKSREKAEPYALFNAEGEPFIYFEGNDGAVCDAEKIESDIDYSLNNGFLPVYVSADAVKRGQAMEEVKRRTRLLCTFFTEYDSSNFARAHNISLACGAINGTILAPSGMFSFNAVVGARTAARGYKTAKIISGGKYVSGLGGGVCQVSTTLYNAVLLSGQEICEQHPHSLGVSYIDPSRDAMVSGDYYDFKFKNISGSPLYIRASAARGRITCSVYGESDGWNYSFESNVVAVLPPPEPEYGAKVPVTARDGVESEGYLVKERGGVRVKKLVRRDSYAPIRGALTENRQNVCPDN